MSYLAFYRTFRPTTFDEVVRQEHIVRILKNQIETDKVGHAYLFCGPRGTGKTTLAKIFARAINCLTPVNASPCGKCAVCRALAEGASLDISEIDAASNNGVDEMRDLREKVQYPPVAGRYKVYIIDEVHMLTPSAFNAVLKTLEEPPRHAVFILATTEPQKIPATILSRCMRFDFKLIPQSDLEELIKSVLIKTGKEFENEAVSAIARAGAGSARDSLSIADMCSSYSRGKLTYADVNAVLGSADFAKVADICGAILNQDSKSAISEVEQILATGKSVGVLLKDLLNYLNYCTIAKTCKSAREIINLPEETFKRIEEIANAADGHVILRACEILSKTETDMRYSTNGRITLETAVLKCAMPQTDYNIDALIGRISALEKKLGQGVIVPHVQAAEPHSPNNVSPRQEKASVSPKLIEEETVQPTVWDEKPVEELAPQKTSVSVGGDKQTVFAKFIKSLRTTHKNAVLFTLCMDLDSEFEGDKLVLYTDSEAVLKALNRADNAKFIAEVLLELGVSEFEIRLKQKGESEFDTALKELKQNFGGVDIDIK